MDRETEKKEMDIRSVLSGIFQDDLASSCDNSVLHQTLPQIEYIAVVIYLGALRKTRRRKGGQILGILRSYMKKI